MKRNSNNTCFRGTTYDNLESAAFDSFNVDNFIDTYDPDTSFYDPDNAAGGAKPLAGIPKQRLVKSGKDAQVDISIVNAGAAVANVELFNHLRSFTKILNTAVSAFNPATPDVAIPAANLNSLIYFDKNGSLIIQDAAAAKCTISCRQAPYRTMFDASGVFNFIVKKIRYTVTTDPQIDNQITHFRTTFLGAKKENPISPRSYFKPDQFQSKLIDIPVSFPIDAEHGLILPVNAGETVNLSLFMTRVDRVVTMGN